MAMGGADVGVGQEISGFLQDEEGREGIVETKKMVEQDRHRFSCHGMGDAI